MLKRMIVIACVGMLFLLTAVAVTLFLCERQPVPPPDVPVAQTPAEVRVKAVERNVETLDLSNAEAAKFLRRAPVPA